MVNVLKLKAKLKELNLTQSDVAKKMGIDPSTFNRKINNSDGKSISVKELNDLSEILLLTSEELEQIFFA